MNWRSKFIFSCVLALMGCVSGSPTREPARRLITDCNAVGDGTTLNTKAIQNAIDACAATGGGVVVVPKGVFLTGALFFKPSVNLRIEQDGVLKGTTNQADYPPIYTRWEGIERYWTSAVLNFVGMTNVEVSGEGMIDGSGEAWPNRFRRGAETNSTTVAAMEPAPGVRATFPTALPPTTAKLSFAPAPGTLPMLNAAGVALPGRGLGRPRTLVFQNCRGVRVSGLHFKNEAS
jgi:polygalacturonase